MLKFIIFPHNSGFSPQHNNPACSDRAFSAKLPNFAELIWAKPIVAEYAFIIWNKKFTHHNELKIKACASSQNILSALTNAASVTPENFFKKMLNTCHFKTELPQLNGVQNKNKCTSCATVACFLVCEEAKVNYTIACERIMLQKRWHMDVRYNFNFADNKRTRLFCFR